MECRNSRSGIGRLAFLYILVIALFLPVEAVIAQDVSLEDGIAAYEDGHYSRAISYFNRVVQEDSAPGEARLWLGRSLAGSGDIDQALEYWHGALLDEELPLSSRLRVADAFINATFSARADGYYAEASEAYLGILSHASPNVPADIADIVEKHAAQMLFMMSDDWLERAIDQSGASDAEQLSFGDGAGTVLMAWWQRHDPMPASPGNPRIWEHLERVAHAESEFRNHRVANGFDQRGELYVRLGPPEITKRTFSYTLAQSLSRFATFQPNSVVWSYPSISTDAVFIFIDDGGGYRVGSLMDMLPRTLRNRSNMPITGLAGLSEFLNQIAVFNTRYGNIQDQVTEALEEAITEWDVVTNPDGSSQAFPTRGTVNPQQFDWVDPVTGRIPRQYIGDIRAFALQLEEELAANREHDVPTQLSQIGSDSRSLEVATRVARFLEDDGSTRTEVFWGAMPGAFHPSDGQQFVLNQQGLPAVPDFLLRTRLALQDSGYELQEVDIEEFEVDAEVANPYGTIPARHMISRTNDSIYNLVLEVQQLVDPNLTTQDDEFPLRRTVIRHDSLQALQNDRQTLEMSDLLPVLLPDARMAAQLPAASDRALRNLVFPFDNLPQDSHLALYFEVYNLQFGDDDLAHYSLEYELERQEQAGGLWERLRGGPDPSVTTTAFERTSQERRTSEVISLELGDLDPGGSLRVHVTVTDLSTGLSQGRTLYFSIMEAD